MSFSRKIYRLKFSDPWTRLEAEELVVRNAEKHLRYVDGVAGKIKHLLTKYYLEVEEFGGERFEMPFAETYFVELDENNEPVAFYRVKVYFHLEGGEFIYIGGSERREEKFPES